MNMLKTPFNTPHDTAPFSSINQADFIPAFDEAIAETREEAKNAVISMMEDKVFGDSGNNIVIEEFLTGIELSVFVR